MTLTRHTTWNHDLAKAIWISIAVIVLTLLIASAAGADRTTPDGRPPDNSGASVAMDELRPSGMLPADAQVDELMETMRVWNAIHARSQGDLDVAAEIWKDARLPIHRATWKHVALGEINLQHGHHEAALEALETALNHDRANPVAHLLKARVLLAMAADVYPRVELAPDATVYVGLTADEPNLYLLRSAFEQDALRSLQETLLNVERLDPETPLMSGPVVLPRPGDMAMPVVSPTVGDLLSSAGIDDVRAEAYEMLIKLTARHPGD